MQISACKPYAHGRVNHKDLSQKAVLNVTEFYHG